MRIIFFCLPDPLHPNWIHTARVRAVERKANISKKNLLFSFDLIKQAVTPRTTISSANLPVRVGTEIMLCSKPQLSASHVLVRSLPIGELVSTGGAPPTQSNPRKQSIGQMRFRPTNAQNGWRGNMVETKSRSSPVRKYEPVINTAQWLLELAR